MNKTTRELRLPGNHRFGTLALILGFAVPVGTQLDQSQNERVIVVGTVADATTGDPIAGATVNLEPRKTYTPVLTSSNGGFVFRGVTPGRYSVVANHPNYVLGRGDARFAGDQVFRAFEVIAGETIPPVTVRLWRFGGIAGRVTDEQGEAIVGGSVAAFRQVFVGGRPQLQESARSVSNDLGEYRIGNPVPGRYIAAVPSAPIRLLGTPRPQAYVTTYYPSTQHVDQAQVLPIDAGEVLAGISMRLTEADTHVLAGSIRGLPAETSAVSLELLSHDSVIPSAHAVAQPPEFSFQFQRIPVGRYRLRFQKFPNAPNTGRQNSRGTSVGMQLGPDGRVAPYLPMPAGETWWADYSIVLDRDMPAVSLVAQPGYRIKGRVRAEPPVVVPSAADLNRTAVLVFPAGGYDLGFFPLARIESDGHFQTTGLPPGKYVLFILPNNGVFWPASSGLNPSGCRA